MYQCAISKATALRASRVIATAPETVDAWADHLTITAGEIEFVGHSGTFWDIAQMGIGSEIDRHGRMIDHVFL